MPARSWNAVARASHAADERSARPSGAPAHVFPSPDGSAARARTSIAERHAKNITQGKRWTAVEWSRFQAAVFIGASAKSTAARNAPLVEPLHARTATNAPTAPTSTPRSTVAL